MKSKSTFIAAIALLTGVLCTPALHAQYTRISAFQLERRIISEILEETFSPDGILLLT